MTGAAALRADCVSSALDVVLAGDSRSISQPIHLSNEVAFFSLFAEPIPGFEENAIEVIADGLRRGACPTEVRRQARLLQAYELDFWQAVGEPPGSPLPVVR